MGRSRRRARIAGTAPAPRATTVAPAELRQTLGAYLAGAIVLAVDAAAAYALYRWAQRRLAPLALTDEDRVMQTLAGGLLCVALGFALLAAVVLTLA
jgi:hypothetical protein